MQTAKRYPSDLRRLTAEAAVTAWVMILILVGAAAATIVALFAKVAS